MAIRRDTIEYMLVALMHDERVKLLFKEYQAVSDQRTKDLTNGKGWQNDDSLRHRQHALARRIRDRVHKGLTDVKPCLRRERARPLILL